MLPYAVASVGAVTLCRGLLPHVARSRRGEILFLPLRRTLSLPSAPSPCRIAVRRLWVPPFHQHVKSRQELQEKRRYARVERNPS
jgi:hypothetical protein